MVLRRLAIGLALSVASAAVADDRLGLVPQPASIVTGNGALTLISGAGVAAARADAGAVTAATIFIDLMQKTPRLRLVRALANPQIRFVRAPGFAAEGYRLDVDAAQATITASSDAGLLYGGITLWQLASRAGGAIPAVTIVDSPRFAWRGVMLDSARHFQSPAFIKKLVDAMAAHKLNRLHWHLVDDQGWRIEIRKYPRLTGIGAWRRPATAPGAPALPMVGGFYTQAQVRDIVRYAAARNVTVVPEIEMPGHALSAIRAYPWLGTGAPVKPGIESHWGVFDAIYNVDDRTFGFLEDVLGEVLSLFPSTYIHVGGDEAVKDAWRASPAVQARMKTLGLANENALQGWFVKRIERFLAARGRKLIGWDEILEGGVPQGAAVMSWRGIDGALAAARAGHDTVLAAAPTLYLNHVQSKDESAGPGRGDAITLADVYAFDPAPVALTPAQLGHIMGLQANLWTEYVRSDDRAAFMLFPRASAVAELGWSPRAGRDYASFVKRLVPQLDRLNALGIKPAFRAFTPVVTQRIAPDGMIALSAANQINADMRYTRDGRLPALASPNMPPTLLLAPSARLRIATFVGDEMVGPVVDTIVDRDSANRRSDRELRSCNPGLSLALEDDAPPAGSRASFLLNIMEPCWIYEKAQLDTVTGIRLEIGQLPFNFQIGKDIEKIAFRKPDSADGEFEVRIDGCKGAVIATFPLKSAMANPGVSALSATVQPRNGIHDLCVTYTAVGPDPLWAVRSMTLLTR